MITPPRGVGMLFGRRSLDTHFVALEQQRENLLSDLDKLSGPQRSFHPSADSWSIPEVADHLMRVERSVLDAAAKPGVRRSGRRRDVVGLSLLWGMLKLGVRVRVPAPYLQPRPNVAVDELRREWDQVRRDWAEFLETLTRSRMSEVAFRHPIAGPVFYKDVLKFLERHFLHHRKQILRIKSAPGYPH